MKPTILFMTLSACAVAPPSPRMPSAAHEVRLVSQTPGFKVSNAREMNPFAKVIKPMEGPSRVMGGYANGCLFGGQQMPKSGIGFEMVRMSRNRYYAHPSLAAVLTRGGKALAQEATMLYGDLAQPRGGPMPGGHSSHQSGLDADIWFHKFPPGKKMNRAQRETLYGQSVLKTNYPKAQKEKNYLEIDEKKWSAVYAKQLMWFADQPEVERIFVNAAIKKRLCKQFPEDQRLAKLRPWFFHDDHFHLRLKCPENELDCVPQKPPEGMECDEKDLAYWFSHDVIAKFTTPSPARPIEADLPLECQSLVN